MIKRTFRYILCSVCNTENELVIVIDGDNTYTICGICYGRINAK